MIFALATGTVSQVPTRRTTTKGNPFATFSIKAQTGDGSGFVSIAVFDSELVPTALALADGDAVSVTGRLELRTWQGRDGQERAGLGITATRLIPLTKPEPRKKTSATRDKAVEAEPFGSDASNLDGAF